MTSSSLRMSLLALLGCAAACGDSREHGGPPVDAGVDAPDAKAPIDDDHDGHPASEDCDDHDPKVWQNLAYHFRDADGDGRTIAEVGMICSGASLPPGYAVEAGAPDCNDADPAVFASVTGF